VPPAMSVPVFLPLWINRAVTPFAQHQTRQPQIKRGGGTGDAPVVHRLPRGGVHQTWRCHPVSAAFGRGQVGTALGVAVPPRQHPEPSFASSSSPTSSPLQICQHHQVFTNLCTCVSFSQTFPKGLATQLAMPLDPNNMQS
jgi:hypothetical protein